jgi:hypothetical protein
MTALLDRRVPRSVRCLLQFAAASWLVGCVSTPNPAAAQSGTIDEVAFLTGCWAGTMGTLDMKEHWSDPNGGVMLGTTRYFREDRLVDFEFAMIVEENDEVVLWPYPRGERSTDGFPLVAVGDEYVFENLEHDFPVRIIYVRNGRDGLSPRIEGRDGDGTGWALGRIDCPQGQEAP